MPIYEYQCEKCAHVFEEWQSGFDELDQECPECGAAGKRLISNTSFILKGSGWYVTEYGGKKGSGGEAAADSGEGSGDGAADASSGDSGDAASAASGGSSPSDSAQSASGSASTQADA
ncbi:FmdB family zinc ribbon protein [Desulfovibrio oxyclinae]|uniref:FmdB family zinc ribbon protein n=1 Tax=Desulfovibrio oxyclinae TaxID=63560 RepID=UPI00036F7A40|nr:zinc ribbon domain-containing protein [Desulfovibrio oxyclinae]